MEKLFVGTSGWSYPHWRKVFYPETLKSSEYLSYYAKNFQAVEINNSFYRLPKEETIERWAFQTDQSFYFCPKLSRYITHIKKLRECEKSLHIFMSVFETIKKRLGPILIQLPPNLQFHEEKFLPFITHLANAYKTYRFALEARHESWMHEKVIKMCSEYNVAWVISDSGGRYPSFRAASTQDVYFRFHGPKSLYASQYTEKTLSCYVDIAQDALKEHRTIWAFFNNDYKGYAVESAHLFQAMLQGACK